FDPSAYKISSSKLESNRLFSKICVPTPRPWPECGFPVVAKPTSASGSKGVRILHSSEELNELDLPLEFMVLQEFVPGPSYSIEVLGSGGRYTPLQVTDLEMDAVYDCKRVTAPTTLPAGLVREFEKIAVDIAGALNLSGLMDVEVIRCDGELKVLEIDARIPSQTPATVFWSTGVNIIQLLGDLFLHPGRPIRKIPGRRGVVYEHIRASPDSIKIGGEGVMSGADPLHVHPDFFGADEALTNYEVGRDRWQATLIYAAPDIQQARARRDKGLETIRRRFGVKRIEET
ncbi:MAG: 3-methylornithine--L-lysine ligase PylC, partial [Desulfobacterales bacterium]|nr:3-methylornithine--L-lysine ligase PylC [Desulfobacterales bacterium]